MEPEYDIFAPAEHNGTSGQSLAFVGAKAALETGKMVVWKKRLLRATSL
jgi:hypothetical protein